MRMRASIQMKKQLQELGRAFGSFPFCGEVCGGVGGKLRQFTQIGENRWMTPTTQQHMPQRSGNPNPNARMGFLRAFSSLEVQHDAIGKFDLRCFAPFPGDHEQQISGRSVLAVCRYKVSEGLRTHASKATAWEAEPEFTADWEAPQSQDNSSQGNQKLVMMGEGDPVDWNQKNVRLREFDARQRTAAGVPAPKVQPDDVYIPVKAFYVSRSIDLKRLSEEPFLEITSSRNNLIIRFPNRPMGAPPTTNKPGLVELSQWHERYMVAFQYGSIVFFNFGDEEEEEALSAMRKFCTDEFRETRKDDYGVLVRPTLPEWSEGGQDQITLRMLDTDNIRVISSILGQSIALDHYAKRVDEMVNTFSELNRGMEKTGTFTMTRKSLFQLVAAANTTLADVILRLGLLERSDAAWKDANYAQIWEYLRDDFELDERFESLDFKLNIIQHNVRFFLDILQNRKSDTLEWIIILLITGEICVSLYDILHTAGAI
ncbi:unnamed protein product [Sphagnum troendelagicum]|uniref:DUF155 domain-containing protein n=1 Tax=Sphagnum troendelagicum TaxID=128251 RepID=A0ABP0U4P6_9BRYO